MSALKLPKVLLLTPSLYKQDVKAWLLGEKESPNI